MENGGGFSGVNNRKITAEEVLTKLKDDGDFDKLRLKISRRIKDDGELRNNIISMVKQSSVLNRPGAENMKPRQLSDAIHQEIGNEVMSQISDSVWKIIRSGDGMKAEITKTVQSVYNKILNPKINECGESSSHVNLLPVQKEHENNGSLAASISEVDQRLSDGELNEPPGFSMRDHCQNNTNNHHDQLNEGQKNSQSHDKTREGCMQGTYHSRDRSEPSRASNSPPPGTSEVVGQKQSDDDSDDDPDVPPGFG